MSEHSLRMDRAAKSYRDNSIFSEISVTFEPGTYYTLAGPNGSGKSTFMSCLLQQEELTEGQVLLDGQPITSASPEFRVQVFGINDSVGWLPGVTVGQHLEMIAAQGPALAQELGLDPKQLLSAREALEELGVPQAYDREAFTLSSGQEQRSKLASLLVRPARYYFLDEPEKRLDTRGIEWVATWAQEQTAQGRAVCLATHEPQLNQLPGTRKLTFPLLSDESNES